MYDENLIFFLLCFLLAQFVFLQLKKLIKNVLRRKEINDCLNRMAKKLDSELKRLDIKKEVEGENADLTETFLKELQNKVKHIDGILNIDYKFGDKILYFSLETQKIQSEEIARKLIDLVDDHSKHFFLKKDKNLSQLHWCAKYMLHSDLRPNSIAFNVRNTKIIEFVWFKNIFRHKICSCFICSEYKNDNRKPNLGD